MDFEYNWKNNEANFGPTIKKEVKEGAHISSELILKYKNKYVALRRPKAIPGHEHPPKEKKDNGYLYFVHNLPRWGENTFEYLNRLVQEQAGVKIKDYRIVDIEMEIYEDTRQWAITPLFIVELQKLPEKGVYGNEVTDIVIFTKENIPEDFGWWTREELKDFLNKFD